MVPHFRGVARHQSGAPVIGLGFWPDVASWEDANLHPKFEKSATTTVEVPGLGAVRMVCCLQTVWPVEQREQPLNPPWRAHPRSYLLYEGHESLVVLSNSGPIYEAERSVEPDEEAWQERVLAEAVAKAGEAPSVALLGILGKRRQVLATCRLMDGLPSIRASVDRGAFLDLAEGRSRGVGNRKTFLLPARPGQAVRLEFLAKFHRFEVTTFGLAVDRNPQASPGLLTLGKKKIPLDAAGRAEVDLGTLSSPEWIEFELPSYRRTNERLKAALLLRHGRPEEAWLESFEFPLSPPPATPSIEATAIALSADLEAGFDPDRGRYLLRRGDDNTATPGWSERSSLDRAAEERPANAWLSMIGCYPRIETTSPDGLLNREMAKPLLPAPTANSPWRLEEGWAYPRWVYALAVLWREFPELREENPIEAVLEGWATIMETHPDPLVSAGKTGYREDRTPSERAFAIAALHLGAQVFGRDEFVKARDLQLDRLRDQLTEAGVLGTGPLIKGDYRRPGPLELVVAWGQLAAFLEDEESLAAAREFIVDMFARKTDRARAAYAIYEKAPFPIRAGLLQVLRGRAGLLEVPAVSR